MTKDAPALLREVIGLSFRHPGKLLTLLVLVQAGLCTSGALAGARLAQPFFTHVYWFVGSSLYPETWIQG